MGPNDEYAMCRWALPNGLTVADSLAPPPINNNDNKSFPAISDCRKKKVLANFPRGFWRFPTRFHSYKKQCCPRAEDRTIIFEDLRLRGQGLDLRGQGLQNVSLRTSSRPRTSSRTPPLLFSLPCLNSFNFFKIGLKLSYFC